MAKDLTLILRETWRELGLKSEVKSSFTATELGNLPVGWKVELIDDLLERIIDYRGKTPKKALTGIPVLSAKSVKNGGIDYRQVYYISQDTYRKWETRGKTEIGDVLLTTEGPLGEVAQLNRDNVAVAQRLLTLRGKPGVLDNTYLKYYLMSYIGQDQLNSRSTGTTVQGIKQSEFRRLLIIRPPFKEQVQISKTLADLDSKIELNQLMNKTLESIAQALFKHWFIDFEFPDENGRPYKSSGGEMVDSNMGLIPRNWITETINQNINFLNGLPLQKYPIIDGQEYLPVIKIRELKSGITESSDKANKNIPKCYLVHDGDILFSWSGSLKVVIWGDGNGALNQHIFKVTINKYPKWFIYFWILRYLPYYRRIAEGKATTMGHIQRSHLSDSLICVPTTKTLENMDKLLSPIMNRIIELKKESRKLKKIRDYLLPKLISGKIRVPMEDTDA
jgi:type I restriction enzyme S subunit